MISTTQQYFAITGLLLSAVSQPALADCRYINGGAARVLTLTLPSTVVVSPTASVGSVLWENTVTGPSTSIYCAMFGFYHTTGWLTPQAPSALYRVYNTAVPGVGMQIVYNGDTPMSWSRTSQYFTAQYWFYPVSRWTFKFIKTGNIPNSGTANVPNQAASFTYGSITPVQLRLLNNNVTFVVPRPTCNLTNRSPSVDFGALPISTTNGLLRQSSFNVSVQCSGGSTGQTTPVRITFTDANQVANRTNNLTITPLNSGMTINLLRNGSNIFYGPESSAAGNPGQILLGTLGNGTSNFPITVRLMRTGTMNAMSSFSALARMTMRYE